MTQFSRLNRSSCLPSEPNCEKKNLAKSRQFDLKLTTEINRSVRRIVVQQIAQIFHDDVCIVVSFQKPVVVVQMMFINVFERPSSLAP